MFFEEKIWHESKWKYNEKRKRPFRGDKYCNNGNNTVKNKKQKVRWCKLRYFAWASCQKLSIIASSILIDAFLTKRTYPANCLCRNFSYIALIMMSKITNQIKFVLGWLSSIVFIILLSSIGISISTPAIKAITQKLKTSKIFILTLGIFLSFVCSFFVRKTNII